MSGLEDRLGDMLSRIAMETQEIKELEQQLTDGEELTDQSEGLSGTGGTQSYNQHTVPAGQILANEALQRDLEGIVCGLQEHLRGLREQVGCVCLQLRLEDSVRCHWT